LIGRAPAVMRIRLMYEVCDISDIRQWLYQLIKRGYFVVIVRLINQQRLIDWCGSN
jgi:hypothetical protein